MQGPSRRHQPDRPTGQVLPPLRVALSAASLLLLTTACTALTPQCRQALEARQRQEALAQQASPGGLDPEALRDARLRQQLSSGFSMVRGAALNRWRGRHRWATAVPSLPHGRQIGRNHSGR